MISYSRIMLKAWTWQDCIYIYKKKQDRKSVDEFSKLRGERAYDEMLVYLQGIFSNKLYGTRLPLDYQKKIVDVIRIMDSSKERFMEVYDELIHEGKQLDMSYLSPMMWRQFSMIATASGMFRLGQIFRTKSEERVLANKHNWRYSFQVYVVCMERRDFEMAKQALEVVERTWIKSDSIKQVIDFAKSYLAILQNDDEYMLKEKKKLEPREKEYYNYIDENEFKLIGPAPGAEGEVDDLCKQIVRFNYRGNEFIDADDPIKRVDLSYYSSQYCREMIEENLNRYLVLKYMVIYKGHMRDFPEVLLKKMKTYLNINELLFNGAANMAPKTIFDMCKFGKRAVEVGRVNLYLGNVWTKKYNIHAEQEQKDMFWWPILSVHEMTSQFVFMKNLYMSGVIAPDEELKKILSLDKEEYIRLMEEKWVLSVIPYKMIVDWEAK